MPYDISFENPPIGIAVEAARKGDSVRVKTSDFTSTEDGQRFIEQLEGTPSEILSLLKPQIEIRASEVDHMLAVMAADGNARIYLNEIPQVFSVRLNRPVEKGHAIAKDDMVEFGHMHLKDVSIPKSSGVLFLFSLGWRKGLYWDFSPLGPNPKDRQHDCEKLFGQLFGYVLFQERFAISETEWTKLFDAQWFPFVGLKNKSINALLNHVRSAWDPDDLVDDLAEEVKQRLENSVAGWEKHSAFAEHIDIVRHAANKFSEGDYMSCSALLFPRIEGVMRSHFSTQEASGVATQRTLAETATKLHYENQLSTLLPKHFRDYLDIVYFANFRPQDKTGVPVSRNSVGHGVAGQHLFNKKAATIALLVIDQLFYSFGASMVTDLDMA